MKFNHFFLLLLLSLNLAPQGLMSAGTSVTASLQKLISRLDANPQSQLSTATLLLLTTPYLDYHWQQLGSVFPAFLKPEECSRFGYQNSNAHTEKDSPELCTMTPIDEWHAPKTSHYVKLPFKLIEELSSIFAILKIPITRALFSTLFPKTKIKTSTTPAISLESVLESTTESQQHTAQKNILSRTLTALTITPFYRFINFLRYTLLLAGIPLDIVYGILRFTFLMAIFAIKNPAFSTALVLWIRAVINFLYQSRTIRMHQLQERVLAEEDATESLSGVQIMNLVSGTVAAEERFDENITEETTPVLRHIETPEGSYSDDILNPDNGQVLTITYAFKFPDDPKSSTAAGIFNSVVRYLTGTPEEDARRLHATITNQSSQEQNDLIAQDVATPTKKFLEKLTAAMLPGLTPHTIDRAQERAQELVNQAFPAKPEERATAEQSLLDKTTSLVTPPSGFKKLAQSWRDHQRMIKEREAHAAAHRPAPSPIVDPARNHPKLTATFNTASAVVKAPFQLISWFVKTTREDWARLNREDEERNARALAMREAHTAQLAAKAKEAQAEEARIAKAAKRRAAKERRLAAAMTAQVATKEAEELHGLEALVAKRNKGSSKPFAHVFLTDDSDNEDSSDKD
jgi:hypothetical protein